MIVGGYNTLDIRFCSYEKLISVLVLDHNPSVLANNMAWDID